ncbi:MAG: phytanoyl-CoA dioxygenase family protein [Alphaproteobacteria bacterium]
MQRGKKLTEQQVNAFKRDGFLSPVDIFTEPEAGQLRTALERAEAKWPEAFVGANRNNAHYNFTVLDEITHNAGLLDAVEDLIGPDILNYGSVLFIKEAHDPGFVSWHQDARYMGLEPHVGVTAWVALSPSTAQSGCMRMIPGSHQGEMRDHDDTFGEENLLTRGQEIMDVDESKAVEILLQPGQISLHDPRVIHSSRPNNSDDRRIGFAIQSYIPPHVVQTKARTYAQLVRGTDPYGNFARAPRPSRDMAPDNVKLRDHVNAAWQQILYAGSQERRDL